MQLIVEVIDAHDLTPKDGEGSATPFVEVDFGNQLSRTTSVPKNLNPIWNQKLAFKLEEATNFLNHQKIEVSVYNQRKHINQPGCGRDFLGRVRIPCSNIVKKGDEVYQSFQLEKKWFSSFVKGCIGLKIYTEPNSDLNSPISPPSSPSSFSSCSSSSFPDLPLSDTQEPITEAPESDKEADIVTINSNIHTNRSREPVRAINTIQKAEKSHKPVDNSSEPKMQRPAIALRKRPASPYMQQQQHQPPSHPHMQQHPANPQLQQQQHPANPQLHPQMQPNYEEDHEYEVKEASSIQQGDRWPDGSGYKGRGWLSSKRYTSSTHDLVEQMFYLYVRVVKARDLPPNSITASCDPYVEVKLGNYKGRTKHLDRKLNPEWNQVFAFSKERVQSSILEVFVRDKEMLGRDDYLGRVIFDLNEVSTRVPPDSPLAPQWFRLEDMRGEGKVRGEVMLAVWMGTQADEAFSEAWHSGAAFVYGEGVLNVRSKVYLSPKLWYLRVNVIEAQDVIPNDRSRLPDVSVKVQLGNQMLKTEICPTKTANPVWNQDLVFVAAEPFEEQLVISVEDHVHTAKDDVLGTVSLPLSSFEKRLDHRPVHSRWYNLEKFGHIGLELGDRRKEVRFSSRLHLRVCLEGGYHVLDESAMYISDQRPTARQLWKEPVGILEMGILGAQGLHPMKMKDGRGCTDAYCVAKYGQKWIRTRTIIDTLSPKWNEQYTWEVYDPCTVITLGVFDNSRLTNDKDGSAQTRDTRIGKVRIRLSTLESRRVYTHLYPLIVLHPTGVKKMGELQLAVRFTSLSLANMLYLYKHSLLPKMHYLHPFSVNQVENLRYQAMNIVAARLSRAEPPLRKEVVEYMLDVDSHMWSMRRSKANFFRIMSLFSGVISMNRWFKDVFDWKNPVTSVLVHILFLILVWYPELILPTVFLYLFFIGLWNYRFRPRHPPHMDTKLSWAEAVHPDELDEEFDTFPTSRQQDVVRMRYDRLRSVAGRIQTVVGDVATQGERFQSLLVWRDPRATSLFLVFCLCAAVLLYVTPVRVVVLGSGIYTLRHPKFRSKLPSVPSNFFKRLPGKTDSLL